MSDNRQRLDTQAIIIGYAMSRLDAKYHTARGLTTWSAVYDEAATALDRPDNTFKNLRDEFDPFHDNIRAGWIRDLRTDRQRVLDELSGVSDEALLELVDRILNRDETAIIEAVDALAVVTGVPANVAERLRTGRLAEEYFLRETLSLVSQRPDCILDCRQMACGYDFSVKSDLQRVFEVKGMRGLKGEILFTDREWQEAGVRQENYWLIVVGNATENPVARVVRNPYRNLKASDRWRQALQVSWRATVSVV